MSMYVHCGSVFDFSLFMEQLLYHGLSDIFVYASEYRLDDELR